MPLTNSLLDNFSTACTGVISTKLCFNYAWIYLPSMKQLLNFCEITQKAKQTNRQYITIHE